MRGPRCSVWLSWGPDHGKAITASEEVRFPCHTARVRRCPPRSSPTWPAAWPTCCHRDRQGSVATHRWPWRSAWTPSPRSCWMTVLPAGRSDGRDLQDRVGDSMDLLLAGLAALGYCQPDGTFITTIADLRERLGEMARTGEAVLVDGLATRVQRPRGWANQKVWYDTKRHAHTAHGDLLWCDGGWPGSCHEHELVTLSGLDEVLDASGVASLLDRGFRGMAKRREHWHAPVGDRRPRTGSPTGSGPTTAARPGCPRWWSSRSGIWLMPGRCAAGGAGSTGFGICTALPGRWSASAGGCTESPPKAASRTPSMQQCRPSCPGHPSWPATGGRGRPTLTPAAVGPGGIPPGQGIGRTWPGPCTRPRRGRFRPSDRPR